MKKIITLFAALFLYLGIAQAQDVYFSGNGNGMGKIWKNNTMLYNIADTSAVMINDMKVADDNTIYSAGYNYSNYRGHVWLNDSVLFTTDTQSFIERITLNDNGWTAVGDNKVWQNGEILYEYSIDSNTVCNLYALAVDDATGDVYTGGSIVTPGVFACVWKNDTILWQCPGWSRVNDLCFDGNNLYAAGFVYGPESIDGAVWQNDSIIFQIEEGEITAITAYDGSIYWAGLSTSDNTAYIWQDGEVIYSHPDYYGFNALCVNEYGVYYAGMNDSTAILWKDGEILYQPEDCQNIVAIAVMPNDDILPYSLPWCDSFETDSTYWDEWAQINAVDSLSTWERFQDSTGFYNARHLASDSLQTSWLITPPLFLQPNQDSTWMTFQTKELDSIDFGYSGVWISTATDDIADFTEIWSQDNPSEEWNQVQIDLSEYQNNIIYLAFKYSGEQAHDWYIDDINVIEFRSYYNLTVEADTTGWGTVTGGGSFYYGDTVVIEAIPNLGCEFLYWNDSITDNPRTIVVTQDSTFTAYFGFIGYSITTSVDPEDAGTVTGGGIYPYGDTLSLEAIPNAGFVFDMWADSITDNPRDIVVTQDSSFIALFSFINYTITTSVEPEGGGTATGSGVYHYGDTLTLEAIPNAGYAFEMWNDSVTDNPRIIVVTSDSAFIAQFQLIDYNIATSVEPENAGTVTGGGTFHYGDTLTLEAIPNAGFVFDMWADSITDNPREIVVMQDSSFIALFSLINYSIVTLADPENGGSVTGGGLYHYGDTITIEALPDAGYFFETWNDGVTDNPRNIVVTQDITFTAHFGLIDYTISTAVEPENAGTVTPGGVFHYGDILTLVAIPNAGYTFDMWSDGVTDNPREIVVTQDNDFIAIFSLIDYSIETLADPENGGTVTEGGIYHYGDNITLEAIPSVGYFFEMWSDSVTDNPRNIVVTQDSTLIAHFGLIDYSIKAFVDPEGTGIVTGVGLYHYGDSLTLEVVPNTGFVFEMWNDSITDNPRDIVVTQDSVFTAHLIPIQCLIETQVVPEGTGIVTGDGLYTYGDTIQLEAIPNEGFEFLIWADGNHDNPRTVVVTESQTYTATFGLKQCIVNAVAMPEEGGIVIGGGTYSYGDTILLVAQNNVGFTFKIWEDEVFDNPRQVIIKDDVTYTAIFSLLQFQITTGCEPVGGGTVEGGGYYPYGETATLYARPFNNYSFICWSDGIVSNPRNITVTQDASYKALFRFDGNPEYIIKVTTNNYTWGSVEGTGVYPEGSTVEIKAIPTDSTQFVRWDDGNTDNPRTITVTSDMVFTAIFEPIPVYTITVRSASSHMGNVYGGGRFMANSVIEIGAIPEEGFYFTGWQDGDMNNPRSIIVTEDAEYEAYFSRTPTPTFTVTVYYDESQGFILGAGTYSAGSTASLAAIPADGYMFVKWSDDTTDNPKEVLVDQDIVLAAFFTGTGVDENGFEIITLYPNPANDIIHIDGLEGEHEVQIYNALGMLVMTTTVQGDSEINICDLPTGYYLIRIDSHHSVKFIKENK